MMANVAGSLLQSKVDDLVSKNKGYIEMMLDAPKDYFDVTNEYVLKKLVTILFPFTVKQEKWKR